MVSYVTKIGSESSLNVITSKMSKIELSQYSPTYANFKDLMCVYGSRCSKR